MNQARMESPAAAAAELTPMMAQYFAIKNDHPGYLLFYRMGDFYELFFEDAVAAAGALDIALTKRGKHLGEDIPMCGVPVHAGDSYLETLIRKGHKVAICEQTEDPKEAKRRGAVVRREVIRLVTPGTLSEEALLDARRNNYLAAVAFASEGVAALAWADMSTGEFSVAPLTAATLEGELDRLEPNEILVPDALPESAPAAPAWRRRREAVTFLPRARFDSDFGRRKLCELFGVGTLDGFGDYGRAELAACGALVAYVELTQLGRLPPLKPPKRQTAGSVLVMDVATRGNLELLQTLSGGRSGSLLDTIDRTLTGAGARLLQRRLVGPLTEIAAIEERLDSVGYFADAADLRRAAREALRRVPDMARALSRLKLDRGGPRDLAAIRNGLDEAGAVRRRLLAAQVSIAGMPAELASAASALGSHTELIDELRRALKGDLPHLARDGGFIARGYHPPLDELLVLRDDGRRVIAGLQARYAEQTGVKSLKVRHNNVLGYFVEVPPQHGDRLLVEPLSATFIHRQTLASAVRFTTVELGELEAKITRAGERALALEMELFAALVARLLSQSEAIGSAADALAVVDVSSALAELACEAGWTRPAMQAGPCLDIEDGRHPVVETALKRSAGPPFVANDCRLDGEAARIWLVTGPNMAGKSTFLRQNALIAILAQMGAFVPARKAHIGIVDRLFSRVGAADDLARGRSTFMVEMVETAAILNQATDRSLVILDEVGRGTATFDGLSIAWASLEHLHDVNRCRALFATHFHELTALAGTLKAVANVTIRVKEWRGDVVFLHEVVAGSADRSYGLQVAKLAGMPAIVLARAGLVLERLEAKRRADGPAALIDDLPLFAHGLAASRPPPSSASDIEQALAEAALDDFTPRRALEFLYHLRSLLRRDPAS